jgi:hypothetical protein
VLQGCEVAARCGISRDYACFWPDHAEKYKWVDNMIDQEKQARLLEAAAFVLAGADNTQMNLVNLNKALFYLDLECLLELGETATRNTYIALKQGPVIARYDKRLVEPLKKTGLAIQPTTHGNARPLKLVKQPGKPRHLVEREVKIARRLGKIFSEMLAATASERSHGNPGWHLAYAEGAEKGGAPKPIDLHIAMQQLLDDDGWMAEPLSSHHQSALKAADDGEGVPW